VLKSEGRAEFSRPDKAETWVTFDRPGAYALQATVTDPGRTGVRRVYMKVLGPAGAKGPSFDKWIGKQVAIPAGERGPADDPDGDGMPNLIEKFFGGDPAKADAPPRLLRGKNGRRFRFRQSGHLMAGSFYALQYKRAAGRGGWRLLPGVTFRRIESPAGAMLMDAVLPGCLDDAGPVDIRFTVSEPFRNRAPETKVSVSSAYGHDWRGALAVDGKGGERNGTWASAGESTPWIRLDWPREITIRGVRLCDRPNVEDHTEAGTLTFSDGSSVRVTDIANDGSAKTVIFGAKTVRWVRFQVTGGPGPNLGLCEFEVLSGGETGHFPVVSR
jgi:hypothetical protein